MPSTGGVFVIDITYIVVVSTDTTSTQAGGGRVLSNIPSTKQTTRLWDRKVDGGFPGMSSYIYIYIFFLHTFSPLLFYEEKEKERLPVYVEITPSRRPLPQMQKPKPSKSLFGISSILHGTWGM